MNALVRGRNSKQCASLVSELFPKGHYHVGQIPLKTTRFKSSVIKKPRHLSDGKLELKLIFSQQMANRWSINRWK
jgi:hypothetical protein